MCQFGFFSNATLLCNMLTLAEPGKEVYDKALDYFCNFGVNLKLFQDNKLCSQMTNRQIQIYTDTEIKGVDGIPTKTSVYLLNAV